MGASILDLREFHAEPTGVIVTSTHSKKRGCYAGIDSGKDGAIALIIDGEMKPQVYDIPTVQAGTGTKRDYDETGLVSLMRRLNAEHHMHVALEKTHSMPKQSSVATFSQGEGLGLWRGILAALQIQWTFVSPQRWKGVVLDGTLRDKQAAYLTACRLYPAVAAELKGPKGGLKDGRCDALCIAEYRRRQG